MAESKEDRLLDGILRELSRLYADSCAKKLTAAGGGGSKFAPSLRRSVTGMYWDTRMYGDVQRLAAQEYGRA